MRIIKQSFGFGYENKYKQGFTFHITPKGESERGEDNKKKYPQISRTGYHYFETVIIKKLKAWTVNNQGIITLAGRYIFFFVRREKPLILYLSLKLLYTTAFCHFLTFLVTTYHFVSLSTKYGKK
jgi:hypothetical protein